MTIGQRIKQTRETQKLTQEYVAKKVGVAIQTIYKYENEIVTNIPLDKLEKIAEALNTTPAYLMGWTTSNQETNIYKYDNISPIQTKKIPLLGEIACGKPIMCEQDFESYIEVGADMNVDFCLKAKGDSMINARILDGDIVFVHKQDMVDNGEIAAVIIDNEATLKRVYYYPDKNKLVLSAENPTYEPFVYTDEELNQIKIIGKAVTFQSIVR